MSRDPWRSERRYAERIQREAEDRRATSRSETFAWVFGIVAVCLIGSLMGWW